MSIRTIDFGSRETPNDVKNIKRINFLVITNALAWIKDNPKVEILELKVESFKFFLIITITYIEESAE